MVSLPLLLESEDLVVVVIEGLALSLSSSDGYVTVVILACLVALMDLRLEHLECWHMLERLGPH